MNFGLFWLGGRKKARAVRLLLVLYSNRVPWTLFVPLLIFTLIDADPASPWSASMALVTTLTVSIASRAGANAAPPRIHTLRSLAPSIVRLTALWEAPFTVDVVMREGLVGSGPYCEGGVKPGMVV